MYTLENFRRHYAAITVSHITTAFINERTVKGQFGMMCKVYITTIRHGPKPGRHEAEAEAFTKLEAEASNLITVKQDIFECSKIWLPS